MSTFIDQSCEEKLVSLKKRTLRRNEWGEVNGKKEGNGQMRRDPQLGHTEKVPGSQTMKWLWKGALSRFQIIFALELFNFFFLSLHLCVSHI